jgi:8-oxo-dGTP pyrophosphatase MutT (NUDIX family)
MSLLRQYQRHPAPDFSAYRRFFVAGNHVGWVRPSLMARLCRFTHCFAADGEALRLHPDLADPAARSAVLAGVVDTLRGEGLVPGWRGELFPVTTDFYAEPLLAIERASAPLFGTLAFGLNVNGYVGRGWGMKVWVARRAASKAVDPGMLDLMVGGGQPLGIGIEENLRKESWEEAGIPAELALSARPAGIITLLQERAEGLRVDLQFNFDLELDADFRPVNQDGEVAGFECIPVSDLIHLLRSSDEFMYDAAIVHLDFLVRQGFIGPDDPEYLPLVAGLRPPLPYESTRAAA